jgi:mono/diheme cytochrome c family protein
MKTVWRLLAVFALLVVVFLGFVFSGIYDVAASSQHRGPVRWVLRRIQHASVERRSEDIQAPALGDPAQLRLGLIHYHEMCVTCHGAPGVPMSEIGEGLNPAPPDLVKKGGREEPGEMFWIAKHGIKMTGMPAFGPTHSDEEIWAMIAFIRRMSQMTPAEYQAMVQEVGLEPADGEPAAPEHHEHEHGEHEHHPEGPGQQTGP